MSNDPRTCKVCGLIMDPFDTECKRCVREGRLPSNSADVAQIRRAPTNPDKKPQPSQIHTYCQQCGLELSPGAVMCPNCEGGQQAAATAPAPSFKPVASSPQPQALQPAPIQQPASAAQSIAAPQPVTTPQTIPAQPATVQPAAAPQPVPMQQSVAAQQPVYPHPTPRPSVPSGASAPTAPTQRSHCPNPQCRAPLTPGVRFCARCGTDVHAGVPLPLSTGGTQYADLTDATKRLFSNPIGNMREVFESLEQQRVLMLSGIFAAFYLICVFISSSKIFNDMMLMVGDLGGMKPKVNMSVDIIFKMAIIALTPVVAVAVCSLIYRSITKVGGNFAGDLYIASLSFLPVGLCLLISSFIGISNIEVILILAVCMVCFMVMLLNAGFVNLSGLSERAAFICVPVTMLIMIWLTSVVARSIVEGMVKSMMPSMLD